EGLRGLAALGVFAAHWLHSGTTLAPNSLLGYIAHLGREWVVVFFVLSGVVNTLSDQARPVSATTFLSRRLRRIFPLYVVGCLAGWVMDTWGSVHPTTLGDVLAALTFTSDATLYALPIGSLTNAPIWSLTYEFWFYLAFAATIAAGRRGYALWAVLGGAALIAMAFLPLASLARSISSLAAYSLCWLWGWALVRNHTRWSVTLGFVGLSAGIGLMLRPTLFYAGNLDAPRQLWLALALGPLFLALLGRIRTRFWPTRHELLILIAATILGTLGLIYRSHISRTTLLLAFGSPALGLLAAGLWRYLGPFLPDQRLQTLSLTLGRYSYALYILHMPILYLAMLELPPFWRPFFVFTAVPLVVWYGETRLHPWLLRTFQRVCSAPRPA
ncbi:MAG: hypothetical protein RL376_1081, partial [Verrucomicrobiota bacterium]